MSIIYRVTELRRSGSSTEGPIVFFSWIAREKNLGLIIMDYRQFELLSVVPSSDFTCMNLGITACKNIR